MFFLGCSQQRQGKWAAASPKGLCVLGIGNTNAISNDLVPIVSATHSSDCKGKKCVRKNHTKTVYNLQRLQNAITMYFSAYTAKGLIFPKTEIRRCSRKMTELGIALQQSQKTCRQRQRNIVGRLISDLEGVGVARGAVELHNLAYRHQPGNTLAAESLQTFQSMAVDGRSWYRHLHLHEGKADSVTLTITLDRRNLQKQITPQSKPCYFSMYAYRDLSFKFRMLLPFEFLRYWEALPVLSPGESHDHAITGSWHPDVVNNRNCAQLRPGKEYTLPSSLPEARTLLLALVSKL